MKHHLKLAMACAALATGTIAHAAVNLVPNGDFSGGNADFTSSYSYSPSGNGTEGQYTVRSNPFPWNGAFVSAGDHTTGSGLAFVANGSPTDGAVVWQSASITVNAATNYFFEAFVMNVCCTAGYSGANSPSILEFSINGMSVGSRTTNLALAGTWEGLSTTWNSGSATSAVLSLINRNTAVGGNDFAVDDISLSTQSIVLPPPPVPEPASIALMLGGLAVVAGAARRRSAAAGR